MKVVITFSYLLLYAVATAEKMRRVPGIFIKQGLDIRARGQGVCPEPVGPDDGGIYVCGTDAGATACYCCCTDYELVGDGERTCQSDGTWSGDEPVCRYTLACPELTPPENGGVKFSAGTDIGSIATYSCNSGFVLSGSGIRICGEGGLWSGDAPTCEPIQCDALSDPDNGAVTTTGTGVGDTATYTCDIGYKLSGDSTRTCQLDGEWSGSPPTCEAIQCDALSDPDNGAVSFKGTGVGDTAKYTCDEGYKRIGSKTLTCQPNGEWSDAPPICEYIECELPPDIEQGSYTLSDGTEVGSVATYSCSFGFEFANINRQSLTCGKDGKWKGNVPICKDTNECKGDNGGCQHHCVNTVGSYYCECKRKFFLLPDGHSCERIDVEFSQNSPIVGDGRMDALIINNDERVTKIECYINCSYPDCPTFPVKDCTDLHYSQEGLVTSRRYCLTFVAHIEFSDNSTGTYTESGKCFVSGSNSEPYYCAVNRVGEPEYIGENDVSLAFAPSGPIDAFRCSTDEGKTFDPCTSRWRSNNFSPGPGEVVVCPVSQICFDAPPIQRGRAKRQPCRCITFLYDTTKGEFGERYKTNYYICF